jgi:manganese/iron transport system substrate-binding protein
VSPFLYPRMRLGIKMAGLGAGALLVSAVLAACGGGGSPAGGSAHVRAVTSLEIFADMVRSVGGARVNVKALLPPGADPHTYELPPNRVADIAKADVVFINGLGLEATIQDVIDNNAGGPVVELTGGLAVLEGGGGSSQGNPHMWLDARLGAKYIERIRDALIQQDPAGQAVYEANAAAYLEQLVSLDREMESTIQSIPPERRKIVTFHDAYPYLAMRYGLEIVGVVVPSPGQEPSAQAVAKLTQTIRDEHVPAVYKEPEFNSAVLKAAASESGARVLDLLSDAYADGVHSYVELMKFDLKQLQEGLGGS